MAELSNIPLERQVVSILARNPENSFGTQHDRGYALKAFARELHTKFGLQKLENLGERHVAHLVDWLKSRDTGRRWVDNKLTQLRWLVEKIGKRNLLPRHNRALGVTPGPRHTRAGKVIPDEKFAEILGALKDERLRMALLLARHVGLRFREAMLFRPGRDVNGGRIWVKRGTKGGRPRYLYVHSDKQREVLREARTLASGDASLMPADAPTFEKWRQQCYHALRQAGVSQAKGVIFHDARRTYAVERMAGHVALGSKPEDAATLVSHELGHGRTAVLAWYIAEYGDNDAA